MGEKAFPRAAVLSIWACWLLLVLPRMVIPPLLPLIERELSLSHEEAALLMSVYMFPYALMQLPAGSLSDRFGKRYFIVLSVLGTCLATLLMAFAQTFSALLTLRIISGIAGGMYYAPSTAYIVQSSSRKDVGMALGLVFTGGSFSNILISLLIGSLPAEVYGWRSFFLICSLPGILFAPLLLFLLRGDKAELKSSRGSLNLTGFWRGLRNTQLILLLAYCFISALSGWSFTTFLPTFYVAERGFSISEASLLLMVYYVTSALAGPLTGVTAKVLGFRIPGVISAATMCVFSYAVPLSQSWAGDVFLLVLWGVLGGLSWASYNALLSELTPQGFQGMFLGVYNLMGFLGGTIGPTVFGRVADTAGFGSFFTLALLLCLAPLAISIILLLLTRRPKKHARLPGLRGARNR